MICHFFVMFTQTLMNNSCVLRQHNFRRVLEMSHSVAVGQTACSFSAPPNNRRRSLCVCAETRFGASSEHFHYARRPLFPLLPAARWYYTARCGEHTSYYHEGMLSTKHPSPNIHTRSGNSRRDACVRFSARVANEQKFATTKLI